ncbi:MAG: BrnT family toxin [Bryobacteraceae bacterium]
MEFEWDPRKAAANLAKHEVSFEEAATAFGDPLGRIVADPRHSAVETRQVLMGVSKERRLLAVMFVERGEAIRIISARRATRPERRDYEEAIQ